VQLNATDLTLDSARWCFYQWKESNDVDTTRLQSKPIHRGSVARLLTYLRSTVLYSGLLFDPISFITQVWRRSSRLRRRK